MRSAPNRGLLGESLDRDGAPIGDDEAGHDPRPLPCEIVDGKCRVHLDPECLVRPIRARR